MNLEYQGDHLVLQIKIHVRSYQKNQFIFYGGEENEENEIIFLDTSAEIINRIIAYCEAEDLPLSMSVEVKKTLAKHNEVESLHQKSISSAGKFKKGKYDSSLFKAHKEFIEKNIKRGLLDHQIKASYHLFLLGNGANFSVPGSGKTTVVLTYFEMLKARGDVDILIVVGPPACFGPWREEFEQVLGRKPKEKLLAGGSLDERRRLYTRPPDQTELFLTSFQTLQNDFELMIELLKNKDQKVLLVIDEAHYIKQLDGRWANAVLAIAPYANYRCVLTGTPSPHSYKDFFNLFAFLWQEHSPLSNEDHVRLQIYEKAKDFEKAASLLSPKLDPLFYRVRKADLNLQPQIMKIISIEMKPVERSVYELVLGNVKEFTTHDYLRQLDAIASLRKGRIMRLRQAVSYPKLLTSAIDGYSEDVLKGGKNILRSITHYQDIETPGKLEKLLNLVKGYLSEYKKIVIWSNFIGTVKLIMDTLDEHGIYAKKIVGETPIDREGIEISNTREKIREEFINPNSGLNVLVANPAACAESISLHKSCNNAIYFDLSFNCAQFLQSLDRIHRVGGSEDKSSYYDFLMYKDTVDEKIYENLQSKSERMKALIDQDYTIYSLDLNSDEQDIELEEIIA